MPNHWASDFFLSNCPVNREVLLMVRHDPPKTECVMDITSINES
jgi:hypothetical protein